jgi:hypothetical protein
MCVTRCDESSLTVPSRWSRRLQGRIRILGFLVDNRQVWVEVTRARETDEKRLVGVFSAPGGEESYVWNKVTDKTRGQISATKRANPDDLTMVVLKSEFSAVDDHLVREYVLGGVMLMISKDLDDPKVYAVPGEPVAMEDNHAGSTEDEGIENLDISSTLITPLASIRSPLFRDRCSLSAMRSPIPCSIGFRTFGTPVFP